MHLLAEEDQGENAARVVHKVIEREHSETPAYLGTAFRPRLGNIIPIVL